MIEPPWTSHGGSGPHLLLVHGFLSSERQWLLNLEPLKAVCQPVTVSLFGHAGAPAPAEAACYEPEYYVAAFERLRVELGTDRWFLLGYSLGAGLTLRYAFEYPERVIGHLFTNSTSALADPAKRAEWRANAEATAAKIRSGGIKAMERIPVHPRHARRMPKPVYEALLEDAAHHDPEGIARTMEITNPLVSVRERLEVNARPCCLVWGTRERRFREHAAYARAHMPGLEIAELDAGHGMNMEAADDFNAAVARFLAQCRPHD